MLVHCQAENRLDQITLMSYNVMFVPSILVFERDQLTRAHLLTQARFLRTSDILCLQEVFQTKPSTILLDALNVTYSYRTAVLGNEDEHERWNETWNDHINQSPWKFVGGGVLILSKWPIVYAVQYFYKNACSAHRFVRTGFVYAKILYGNSSKVIHVFGTHLQPNDYRGCYQYGEGKIREKQMEELNEFYQSRNIPREELLFILGDFNINKYNTKQYETMLDILNVHPQNLYSSSQVCSWDSLFNGMTNARHGSQLLDYIFVHRNHSPSNWHWWNLITDRMASKQWHLLGRNHSFYNPRNLPLLELSDHYPVMGFFSQNQQQWPTKSSGVITYVKFLTLDTNLPVVLIDRELRLGKSSNTTGSLFLLTNNGTPRRHRCLRSEQNVLIIDGTHHEYYLSNDKSLRMKYGKEHVNRYLKIIQIDHKSTCIRNQSIFILQSRLSTGYYYVQNRHSKLCSCTIHRNQAQHFRLIEIERRNSTCTIVDDDHHHHH